MAYHEQTMERRARQLGERLKGQVESGARQMGPTDHRPPFHDMLSPREALAFWMKHRYDQIGEKVLGSWSPIDVAKLDAWLTAASQVMHPNMQPDMASRTQPVQPFKLPNGDQLITQSMGQERRIEGPPLGSEVA